MGMYTEIFVKIQFEDDLDAQSLAVLKHMVDGDDCPSVLPEHELFKTPRWSFMLQSSSFYHVPFSNVELKQEQGTWYLCGRADLKDYENEIEKFFDWVRPLVYTCAEKTFVGYSLYEEDEEPKLFYIAEQTK